MKRLRIIFTLIAVLILLAPNRVYARSLWDDQVVLGGTYTLRSGERQDGDIVVLGGSADLEVDSLVNGDIVVIGGELDADGVINGNLVGIAGNVHLGENAIINGDLVAFGVSLQRNDAAMIRGQVVVGTGLSVKPRLKGTFMSPNFVFPTMGLKVNPFFGIVWFVFRILLWGFLATILVMFFPKQTDQVVKHAFANPGNAVGVGLLSMAIAVIAISVMIITIVLIPIGIVSVLALVVAWMFGLIAIGYETGNKLMQNLGFEWAPALTAGLGTIGLMFVILGFEQLIPCIGFVPKLIVGLWGLGAVLLSRFGSQSFRLQTSQAKTGQPIDENI